MARKSILHRILSDQRAASAVEFALLAPVFFALMFGVISVGVYMQNYNAIRSLASDAARFATVEYQKNNAMNSSTLAANIEAMGVTTPYNLNPNLLTISVSPVTPSRVNGALEFDLDITYALPDIIGGTSIDNITLNYSRPLFVLQ
ncbi:pilus assembly protein [Altererythrobacter salegens]|uniref:Pilus assembly protein n=1 Tax=Croceibacterium salegens TaxID=1737568 RepID=A0A6I4SUP3_9SPHN|nr:TadE/TadG family type IV pilus assembly protein [Croceibacterium salegens]MXO59631.1 pilus assembly protein [Croceibacterium salegens]